MQESELHIERLQRRARQYWWEDGLWELAIAVVFLLIALMFLVQTLAAPDSALQHFADVGLPIIVVACALFGQKAVARVKERLTYRRSGYVVYRRPAPWRRLLTAGMGLAMGILFAWLLSTSASVTALLPALQGLIVSLALLYAGHTFGLWRFYVLAALSVVTGAVCVLSELGGTVAAAVGFGVPGVGFLLSGLLTLIVYLRRTSASAQEGQP